VYDVLVSLACTRG